MGILGIDIGSSTIKIIEYKDEKILSKGIFEGKDYEKIIDDFISVNNIEQIDRIVLTGINAKRIDVSKHNVPVEKVEEFNAVATGGLYLSKKDKAIIASIGTGTALIRAEEKEFKHLGGTGVGAGTLTNLCKKFAKTKSFEEIIELSKQGDLSNIDLRIADLTDENIETLPPELTLANFGKLSDNASKSDIVIGLVNMVFEVIGMMTAFASINDNIKDIVLIGNIVSIPVVKDVLKKIEKTHNVKFTIPEEPQFAVAIGAIKNAIN
ncbi:MAG: pantothenate kinase [Clostridia bacterium]|nr:pantothenate kinase [Clostridia bacterium]